MSRPRSFHRPPPRRRRWAIIAAVLLVGGGLFGYAMLQALGVVPEGTRSERVGAFEVVYNTYDAFGHRGTQRTLYYRGSARRRRLVARSISGFRQSPANSAIALYEYCPTNSDADCGVYLFDGRRAGSRKVSDERLLSQSSAQLEWSQDGRLVLLATAYTLNIIDLGKPDNIDLTATLGLREGGGRFLKLGSWSPDQRRLVGLVGQYVDPAPPFVTLSEDLVVIDPYEGTARYIATAQPRGWSDLRYDWVASALGYTLAVPAEPPRIGRTVYKKSDVELPLGILPQ